MSRRKQERVVVMASDDADVAAGGSGLSLTTTLNGLNNGLTGPGGMPVPPQAPASRGGMSAITSSSDIEFYEDLISDPVLVLGVDITHLPRNSQFLICATGVFFFSLLYGYLQELLSVELCSRQLGLYLAMVQFIGYTFLAFLLNNYVYKKQTKRRNNMLTPKTGNGSKAAAPAHVPSGNSLSSFSSSTAKIAVPFALYLGLSMLRAVDLAMTNLAMQFINYPAKTLMKSSRVVFTMIFGVLITHKRYKLMDYAIVLCMVFGLAVFMHADATSSAVFQPLGVIMLTISLLCDGAITNMSESIMTNYGVGQDEFIFRMYSIALVAIIGAAAVKGDLTAGLVWMLQPGTYEEQLQNVPLEERSWSAGGKMMAMIVFSSMGFFGSSCAAAITKQFGALAMSITSTARKATTLFLSFLLFNNECTVQHIVGIVIFIASLTVKSLRRKNKNRGDKRSSAAKMLTDLELGGGHLSRNTSFISVDSGDEMINVAESRTGRAGRRKNALVVSASNHNAASASPGSIGSQRGRYHVV
ncbi:MAG: hypothetical protein SGILL_009726 [Bacillariaceae sp.]